MAMRLCVFAAFWLAASACLGNDGCTAATEYQPVLCPIKLARIAAIQIEENGAKSAASEEQVDCSQFKLTPKGVRRYLSRAMEANESDAHHTLDWSPCYASGIVTFADGKKAHWSISQAATGSLSIHEQHRLFLYCPSCKKRPFRQ
jgi:hypothetical protein